MEKATATVADAEPSKANLKAKGGAAARAAAAAVASAGSAFARAVERYKLLPAAPKTKQVPAAAMLRENVAILNRCRPCNPESCP